METVEDISSWSIKGWPWPWLILWFQVWNVEENERCYPSLVDLSSVNPSTTDLDSEWFYDLELKCWGNEWCLIAYFTVDPSSVNSDLEWFYDFKLKIICWETNCVINFRVIGLPSSSDNQNLNNRNQCCSDFDDLNTDDQLFWAVII